VGPGVGGGQRGGQGEDVSEAFGGLVGCGRGEALDVCGREGVRVRFQAGDPDDAARGRVRSGEERGEVVR